MLLPYAKNLTSGDCWAKWHRLNKAEAGSPTPWSYMNVYSSCLLYANDRPARVYLLAGHLTTLRMEVPLPLRTHQAHACCQL